MLYSIRQMSHRPRCACRQVIEKEVALLNSSSFHCTVATCRQFLRRYAKAARADHRTHEMAHVRGLFFSDTPYILLLLLCNKVTRAV